MNDRVQIYERTLAEDLVMLGLLEDAARLPPKRGRIVGLRKYRRYAVQLDGEKQVKEYEEKDLEAVPLLDKLAEL